MPSLTPQQNADETVWAATKEGMASGGLVMIPSALAVYSAMKFSPRFVKSTNWQSRTAMVIMPPFFAFVAAAEHNLVHSMQSMASTAEHSKKMAEWSRQHELDEHQKKLQRMTTQKILGLPGIMAEKDISTRSDADYENQIVAKFRESVVNSGVRVVPGDSLGFHHKVANFWQENPFKILAAIGVPAVLYIFKGRDGQQHLQTQMKIMHTRVIGQFAVISMLLSLMSFKEYMDRSGKFITEGEVEARVAQMQQSRVELLTRLQRDREESEKISEMRRKAHEADLAEADLKSTENN
ncbi:hypothetical protein ACHAW5_000993 [Stephanodiscus triporus]|uniref:HIG1 domain-containing protein n=1 Tax=Stephanodiscus triporus TaxID=2934178 RepID=A0ABD3NAB3_9STRA